MVLPLRREDGEAHEDDGDEHQEQEQDEKRLLEKAEGLPWASDKRHQFGDHTAIVPEARRTSLLKCGARVSKFCALPGW